MRCWRSEPKDRPSFQGEMAISLATRIDLGLPQEAFPRKVLLIYNSLCCLSDCQPKTNKTYILVRDKVDDAVSEVSSQNRLPIQELFRDGKWPP